MTRLMLPLLRPTTVTDAEARDALLGLVHDQLAASTDLDELTLDTLVSGPMMLNTARPDGRHLTGLLSLRSARPDLDALLRELRAIGLDAWAYEVDQDIPRDYERSWPNGTPSPGVRQITLLQRRTDLQEDAFLQHWHGVHGPLALEVHPIWRYDRNRVLKPLTPDAPALDGIVALHFREMEDVTDPLRMYGGDLANVRRISRDVASFIDMSSIIVTVMQELRVR